MSEEHTVDTGLTKVERCEYAPLVDSLAGALDLRQGLADAVNVASYAAMSSHISNLLNLEAGLQSALATHRRTERLQELRVTTRFQNRRRSTSPVIRPSETPMDLRGLSQGDPVVWEEVLRRYGNLVYATVRSFRLQDADALDAVQTTWMRLAENADCIHYPERLGAWLTTTARRECLRILRQTKQAPRLTDVMTDTIADPTVEPERRVIETDIARRLWSFVSELSPRQRSLLRALFTDQIRPQTTTAHTTEIPLGAIGPTRTRALAQLRGLLEKPGSTAPARAPDSKTKDFPIAPDILNPEVVRPLRQVAEQANLPVTRVYEMLGDALA